MNDSKGFAVHSDTEPDIKRGVAVLLDAVQSLTDDPGVYKMISGSGVIMYVGKAKNIAKRVLQYTQIERLPNRLKLMVSLVRKVEVIVTKSEEAALLFEAELIKGLQPKFNIALKDDKSFPYIAIDNNHQFPRVFKYRGNKKKGVLYFGPFMNVHVLEEILLMMQKVFKSRNCTDQYFARRQKPCLLYQIARCSAPCVGKVDETRYLEDIRQARKFLTGDVDRIREDLIAAMENASARLEFEKAAEYRDKIRLLAQLNTYSLCSKEHEAIDIFAFHCNQMSYCIQIFSIRAHQNIGNQTFFLEDLGEHQEVMQSFIMEYYSRHEKPKEIALYVESGHFADELSALLNIKVLKVKKNDSIANIYAMAKENAARALEHYVKNQVVQYGVLQDIRQLFALDRIPERIEAYDNSHIQGQYAVGCMVVHDGRAFLKDEYRIFKISKEIKAGDDYGMMRECLMRRLKKLNENNKPDLLLIDGGQNHLRVVQNVLAQLNILNIRVVAIAKGEKRNAGEETFFLDDGQVMNFAKNDPSLYFLQRIRDEVHRFAITSHRKLRKKETFKSFAESMPGIGLKREKLLLSIFGSYDKIKGASLKELQGVPSIGKKFAALIYGYLHSDKVQ